MLLGRTMPLMLLALFALGTLAQIGCSSGGGGTLYTEDDATDSRETPEPKAPTFK